MLFAQVLRFFGVGAVATGVHVFIAMVVDVVFSPAPLLSNFCGFSTAVFFSYIGHTRITFAVQPRHGLHFPRFLFVSLLSLTLSSLITWWGAVKLEAPFAATMLVVAIAVPLLSFLLLKLWALKE